MGDGKWYIVDARSIVGNCAMFWGPNRSGYVCDIREAGRYSEEEARHQQRQRSTDVAVPCEVIDAMVRMHVRADTTEFSDAIKAARLRDPAPPEPKRRAAPRINCAGCGRWFTPAWPDNDRCSRCQITRLNPGALP